MFQNIFLKLLADIVDNNILSLVISDPSFGHGRNNITDFVFGELLWELVAGLDDFEGLLLGVAVEDLFEFGLVLFS